MNETGSTKPVTSADIMKAAEMLSGATTTTSKSAVPTKLSSDMLIYPDPTQKFGIGFASYVAIQCEGEDETDFFSESISQSKKTFLAGSTAQLSLDASHWLVGGGTFERSMIPMIPDELVPQFEKAFKKSAKVFQIDKDMVDPSDVDRQTYLAHHGKDEAKIFESGVATIIKKIESFSAGSGGMSLDTFARRYMFKKHVLVKGEKGGGKTWTIDKMLVDMGIKSFFIAGHEGIESTDLLGYYTKDSTGALIWMDGAITEAFRYAQTNKCVVFFDELLRVRARELNILVGSLSPSSTGMYRLRTNRIIDHVDGIGVTEVLEIPMENLWVVGTTNVGSKYNVDDIDEALGDRFRVFQKDITKAEIRTVLTSICNEKFGSDMPVLVNSMTDLYEKVSELNANSELEKTINLRHLSEALIFSNTPSDIKMELFNLIPNITSTDNEGRIDKAEKDILLRLIKSVAA